MPKSKQRPAWVEKAVKTNDLASLRFAAEKSHEARAKKKDRTDAEDQYYRERQVASSDVVRMRAAEIDREHIVPLDPNSDEEGLNA